MLVCRIQEAVGVTSALCELGQIAGAAVMVYLDVKGRAEEGRGEQPQRGADMRSVRNEIVYISASAVLTAAFLVANLVGIRRVIAGAVVLPRRDRSTSVHWPCTASSAAIGVRHQFIPTVCQTLCLHQLLVHRRLMKLQVLPTFLFVCA